MKKRTVGLLSFIGLCLVLNGYPSNENHLSFREKFVLLSICDKNGGYILNSISTNHGLAGTILLELFKKDKIVLKKKVLIVKDMNPTGDMILDRVLERVKKSKKERSLRYWVGKIGKRAHKYKKSILENLMNRQILTTQKKKSFIFFKKTIYPTISSEPEQSFKKKLCDSILYDTGHDWIKNEWISILYASGLRRSLFEEKNDRKLAKKRMKAIFKTSSIGKSVDRTIDSVEDSTDVMPLIMSIIMD